MSASAQARSAAAMFTSIGALRSHDVRGGLRLMGV
jgi:hypothetical protein